jgi:hypothetical protein
MRLSGCGTEKCPVIQQEGKQRSCAGMGFWGYSMWIASDGQTSTQVWQSTHMSLSTFALSFSMDIADAGHSLTQVSHPVHFSLSTTATNSFTPSIMFRGREKKGFYLTSLIRGESGEEPAGFFDLTGFPSEIDERRMP